MATPSSKPNPGATPTHLTSPHPSAVPMGRPLSHKSPSMRTPSASGHGHAQQPQSFSAHQSATPLAATTSVDDPVTFSSPSALLALGGYTGISPSPAAHDGLVGPGMHENDIHALGMQGLRLGGARDNDEERRRHIEEVVQLLRTRVAGRGVCREGVERLGQLEGFESIWQENSISIAGNSVDLEIEFYPGQDTVKDVSLKYATPDAQEGERRDEATAVLKRDLIQSPEEREQGVWKRLDGFHANLERLAKLDKLSREVNCFEAIEGLYESLRRIWDEEKRRPKYERTYEHLCKGWIGRPCLHKGGRVGLGLEYWIEQHRALDAKQRQASPDAMNIDQPSKQDVDDGLEDESKIWSATIECETGYPSLRVSKDWVGPEVLTTVGANEPSSSSAAAESEITLVNWADPPPTLISSINGSHSDPMALDSGMLESATPNRRFGAKLEPPVHVPILAASDIYRHLGMQLPQEFKMVTYDGLLVPSPTGEGVLGSEEPQQFGGKKRRKSVITFDSEGKPVTRHHSYTFQAFEAVAGRTLRDLPFSHPRQLSDIFPILRQYALLASFVRKIFTPSDNNDAKQTSKATKLTDRPGIKDSVFPVSSPGENDLIVLSNDDPKEDRLNSLLNGYFHGDSATLYRSVQNGVAKSIDGGSAFLSPNVRNDDIKVDITLRTQIGQSPLIMLLFSVEDEGISPSTAFSGQFDVRQISIHFEIGLNGRITVTRAMGLWDEDLVENDSSDTQVNNEPRPEVQAMQKKLAKVLEASEDLGILVEWVLQWLRQRKDRA
ncbi:hypothetical protein VTN02DRAFT_4340 [Thermoascus thermophilus]